ncbi:MAG: hypothetical protein MRJ67_00920 [Nitrospirales bacterium]|nr:hypothetical protein [Nitrospirales bacterium]
MSSKILRHIARPDFKPSYNLLLVWTSQRRASRIGIINEDTMVLTGQLEHRSTEEPAHLFEHTRVYARFTPAQKLPSSKRRQSEESLFVKYTMTSNFREIWTIFLEPLFALPIPLLPIQLL